MGRKSGVQFITSFRNRTEYVVRRRSHVGLTKILSPTYVDYSGDEESRRFSRSVRVSYNFLPVVLCR